MDNTYSFTAIRGVQAGRAYYVATCPLAIAARIFSFTEHIESDGTTIPHNLNRAAVPKIADYIVANPDEYVLSSLTVAIGGEAAFEPLESSDGTYGQLRISMTTRLVINDGQHRCAAIKEALNKRSELRSETILVIFVPDPGLERSAQMFSDLNRRH